MPKKFYVETGRIPDTNETQKVFYDDETQKYNIILDSKSKETIDYPYQDVISRNIQSSQQKYQKKDIKIKPNSLIKYANGLDVSNIGSLNDMEHNIFSLIMAGIRDIKGLDFRISLASVRKELNLKKFSNGDISEYIEVVFNKFMMLLQYKTKMKSVDTDAYLIDATPLCKKYQIYCGPDDAFLYFQLDECANKVFFNIQETFTQLLASEVLQLKGKYTKSLYYLLSSNFKGVLVMDIESFRRYLGFPASYNHHRVVKELNNSIDKMKKNRMFQDIKYEFEYACGRGRPVVGIKMKYEFTTEYQGKLHGQGNLEGLDSNTIDMQEEKKENTTKMTLIENYKCPQCGADVYYRLCNDGRHQAFCKNNKFVNEKIEKITDGAAGCTTTNFFDTKEELDAAIKNNNLFKEKQEVFDKEETRKSINSLPLSTDGTKIAVNAEYAIYFQAQNIDLKYLKYITWSEAKIQNLINSTVIEIDEETIKQILSIKRKYNIPSKD